jgi:TrkA domain protein
VAKIEETPLPGVGIRYSYVTEAGNRVSVLHHHSGRHDVFVEDRDDPDAARQVLSLTDDDSRTLAELLGTSQVVRQIDELQQTVAGLTIEWAEIAPDTAAAGRTIGELEIRSSTGVTVVAAARGGRTLPVPGPEFRIEAGDTIVIIGRPDDMKRVHDLLQR